MRFSLGKDGNTFTMKEKICFMLHSLPLRLVIFFFPLPYLYIIIILKYAAWKNIISSIFWYTKKHYFSQRTCRKFIIRLNICLTLNGWIWAFFVCLGRFGNYFSSYSLPFRKRPNDLLFCCIHMINIFLWML